MVTSAERMAAAAAAFLAALGPRERRRAQWPFPSDAERRRWFYTPTDHGGLTVGSVGPRQQQLAMRLLSTGLSEAGYVTASTVMGLENVLDQAEGWNRDWGRKRGRDPGLYYLRVFGDPGPHGAWSWRFGGHHLSIHHVVLDGRVASSSPCFIGVHPARAPLLGPHPLRPLEGIEELARELVRSLAAGRQEAAVISPVPPPDIVSGNRAEVSAGQVPMSVTKLWRRTFRGHLARVASAIDEDAVVRLGYTPAHEDAIRLTKSGKGLPARLMTRADRQRLRSLLDLYTGRLPDELAAKERRKYRGAGLDNVSFAWAGSMRPGQPHYYRVQGSEFLVEYDNTNAGADHIHSVWRVPSGDFGNDVLRTHIAEHHRPG